MPVAMSSRFRSRMTIVPLWNTLAASVASTAALIERLVKVPRLARTAGCDERNGADAAKRAQLLYVVATAHAVAGHAVEHDLACAALLYFPRPFERVAAGIA